MFHKTPKKILNEDNPFDWGDPPSHDHGTIEYPHDGWGAGNQKIHQVIPNKKNLFFTVKPIRDDCYFVILYQFYSPRLELLITYCDKCCRYYKLIKY